MNCSICDKTCSDERDAYKAGWEWFTGYLKSRFAACADCQQIHSIEIARIRRQSLSPVASRKA